MAIVLPSLPSKSRTARFWPLVLVAILIPGSINTAQAQKDDSAQAHAQAQAFAAWKSVLRQEALARGITGKVFDAEFKTLKLDDRVLRLDQSQPEIHSTADDYMTARLNPKRIAMGREAMQTNATLLKKLSKKFAIEPHFIVALWGVESDYGHNRVKNNAVAALTTLAYDGRRAEFFRGELLDCLWIIQNRRTAPHGMKGSWAGALGQVQFLPSSYLESAVNVDGLGPPHYWPDIWQNRSDIFASIANYMVQAGWKKGQGWGFEVVTPTNPIALSQMGMERQMSLADWAKIGVVAADGQGLKNGTILASLIRARDNDGDYYLVTDNFKAILKWNRSVLFALVVGRLADELEATPATKREEKTK
ncbi:MAG: lytic murein transglycosylase [Candidatus Pacebacteria bacterium]|nr:lytic murein transglycosylase [Candidatus Paceibacterota bacterium]